MSTYQTTGLILSSSDFREADKIFSIYTDRRGKIEALATGVRKITSKLRAHLEPFSVIDLRVAQGHHFDRLIGAVSLVQYKKIKSNYDLIFRGSSILEVVDQLTKFHHPDVRIFNLLKEVFDFCETRGDLEDFNSLRSYFIINFLSLLGYLPELTICIRCKARVSGKLFFSFRDGSVICKKCVVGNDREVSQDSLGLLKQYLTQKLQNCSKARNDECYQLIEDFLRYHLDGPLKSRSLVYA